MPEHMRHPGGCFGAQWADLPASGWVSHGRYHGRWILSLPSPAAVVRARRARELYGLEPAWNGLASSLPVSFHAEFSILK